MNRPGPAVAGAHQRLGSECKDQVWPVPDDSLPQMVANTDFENSVRPARVRVGRTGTRDRRWGAFFCGSGYTLPRAFLLWQWPRCRRRPCLSAAGQHVQHNTLSCVVPRELSTWGGGFLPWPQNTRGSLSRRHRCPGTRGADSRPRPVVTSAF